MLFLWFLCCIILNWSDRKCKNALFFFYVQYLAIRVWSIIYDNLFFLLFSLFPLQLVRDKQRQKRYSIQQKEKQAVEVVLIQVSNVSKSIQKHWEGRTCGSKSVFTASHQVLRFSTKKGGRLMYTYYTYPIRFPFPSHLLSLSGLARVSIYFFLFLWTYSLTLWIVFCLRKRDTDSLGHREYHSVKKDVQRRKTLNTTTSAEGRNILKWKHVFLSSVSFPGWRIQRHVGFLQRAEQTVANTTNKKTCRISPPVLKILKSSK